VLEKHHNTNSDVAAVGVGMGGSLAFEAAIVRRDLEAAVAFGGFPQRYFGRFKAATTPILAFYGQDEPHITQTAIDHLRQELRASPLASKHQLVILRGVGHEFFTEQATEAQLHAGAQALTDTFAFLDQHLKGPTRPLPKRF
jgi:dienelactone hydrolase